MDRAKLLCIGRALPFCLFGFGGHDGTPRHNATPLFAGNDLTNMTPETLETLKNSEAIAIDQDSAGVQGHRVWQQGPTEVWVKPLADGSKAVAVFNRETRPTTPVILNCRELGLPETDEVRDLWQRKELGSFHK